MITRRRFNAAASASLLVSSIAPEGARALVWPTHAVRIIVPFAAGGPTDVIARIVIVRLEPMHLPGALRVGGHGYGAHVPGVLTFLRVAPAITFASVYSAASN